MRIGELIETDAHGGRVIGHVLRRIFAVTADLDGA
jgi:hypothetical protein